MKIANLVGIGEQAINCRDARPRDVADKVVFSACSRRVIGWALDRTLEDELPLAALGMALTHRTVQPGLVHHSDRGSQSASHDYTDLLKAHQIEISMPRKGNPWDNAACESFMKTLKYEEVLGSEYRDLVEARASIREFLEKIYNQKRLHSALGYLPPAEFERKKASGNLSSDVGFSLAKLGGDYGCRPHPSSR